MKLIIFLMSFISLSYQSLATNECSKYLSSESIKFQTAYGKLENFEFKKNGTGFRSKRALSKGLTLHLLRFSKANGYQILSGTIVDNKVTYSNVRGLEDMVVGGFLSLKLGDNSIVKIPHGEIDQIRGTNIDLSLVFEESYPDSQDFAVSQFEGTITTQQPLLKGLTVHLLRFSKANGYQILSGTIVDNKVTYSNVRGLEDMVVGGFLSLKLGDNSIVKIPHGEIDQIRGY